MEAQDFDDRTPMGPKTPRFIAQRQAHPRLALLASSAAAASSPGRLAPAAAATLRPELADRANGEAVSRPYSLSVEHLGG